MSRDASRTCLILAVLTLRSSCALHLGQYYRCYRWDEGTLYFFAEEHVTDDWQDGPGPFPKIPLSAFMESMIPSQDGKNRDLTLAKYSARLALWHSPTECITRVDDIRWIPDGDSHTLPIGRSAMKKIAERFDLTHVPRKLFCLRDRR